MHPPPPALTQVRSILIIHFRYAGDLILATPLFANLALQLPNARLSVLAEEAYRDVVGCFPDVDEFIAYPRSGLRGASPPRRLLAYLQLVRTLKAKKFDTIIDLAHGKSSRAIVRSLNPSVRVGYPYKLKTGKRSVYTHLAAPYRGNLYRDYYLQPLQALGLKEIVRDPVLRPCAADRDRVLELLGELGLSQREFAVVHPGARVRRKCWPIERFAMVADALSRTLPVLLVGGPDERDLAERATRAGNPQVKNLAGQLSIGQLAALMQRCRLFIGNDSGPMHVAAASGAPVIALFGPTLSTEWSPIGPANIVLERTCHCGLNMAKPTPCDLSGPECLRAISVEEVLAAANQIPRRGEANQ